LLYRNQTRRNVVLLECARDKLNVSQVNRALESRTLPPISAEHWVVWVNFLFPLTEMNSIYWKELVYNNRSLAWFARDLKKQYYKTSLS